MTASSPSLSHVHAAPSVAVAMRAVRSVAIALIVLAALTPACCLNGAHAHAGGVDGFGAVCFSHPAPA